MEYFEIIIATIFVNNILLAQFLGNCPFLGTSKKMETAVGMSMAVIFVLVMAGVITWITDTFILKKFDLEYLRTIAFILVIASLVQFVEMFLKKSIPTAGVVKLVDTLDLGSSASRCEGSSPFVGTFF